MESGLKILRLWIQFYMHSFVVYLYCTYVKRRSMSRKQFEMEFIFKASPSIIYEHFSTPSGLTRWFCDTLQIEGNKYIFGWSGSEEVAELVQNEPDQHLRFKWEDADEGEYWDIRIHKSPITNDTVLNIVDFADEDEIEDQKEYWKEQINALRNIIGG